MVGSAGLIAALTTSDNYVMTTICVSTAKSKTVYLMRQKLVLECVRVRDRCSVIEQCRI